MSYTEKIFKNNIKELSGSIKRQLNKSKIPDLLYYQINGKNITNPANPNPPKIKINNNEIIRLSVLNKKKLEENDEYKKLPKNNKNNTKFRVKYASVSSDTYIIPLLYLIYAYIYVKYNKIEKYSENKKNNVLSVDTLKIIFSHKNPAIKNVNVFLYNSFNKKDNKNNKLVENKNENTSKLKFLMENSSINDKILNVLNKIKIIWDKEEEPVNEYIEIILEFLENFVDVLQFLKKIYNRNYPNPGAPAVGSPQYITYIYALSGAPAITNMNELYIFIENLKNINFISADKKDYNEKLNSLSQSLIKLKTYNLVKKIDESIFTDINTLITNKCTDYKNNFLNPGITYDKPALEAQFNSINKYKKIGADNRTNINKLIIEFDNKKDLFEKLNDANINLKNNAYKLELKQINKNILEGYPAPPAPAVPAAPPAVLAIPGLKDLITKKYDYDEIFLSIKNIIENENAFLDNTEFKSNNNEIKKYKVDVSGNFRKLEKTKKKDIDEKVKLYEKELKILENQKIKLDALLSKNNKNEISKIDSEINRLNGEIDKLNKITDSDLQREFNSIPLISGQSRYFRNYTGKFTRTLYQNIDINQYVSWRKNNEIPNEINIYKGQKNTKEQEKFEIKQKKDKLAEDKKIIDLQISTYKDSIKKLSINKTNLNNSSKVNNKSDFLNIFDDFINYSDLISKKIDAEQLNKVKDKFYYLLFTKDNLKNLYDISASNIDKINKDKTAIKTIINSPTTPLTIPPYNSIKTELNKIKTHDNTLSPRKQLNKIKYNISPNNISDYISLYKEIIIFKNKFTVIPPVSVPILPPITNKNILNKLNNFLIFFNYTVINNINTYFERKAKKDPSIFINSLLDLYQKQNPQNESLVFIEQIKKIDNDLTYEIQSVLNKIYVNLENEKDKLINIDLSPIQKSTLINTIKESSENYEKNTNISGKYKKVIPYTDIILAYFLELSYIIDILNHVLYEMYK
jgi:hypothetical protein